MKRVLLPLAVLLSGCATPPTPAPATPPPNAAIVYETLPCYGTCPVYRLVVTELTGSAFVGEQHTALVGERPLVAPAAYARIEMLLRRWRPQGSVRYAMGESNCPNAPTDMPGVRVVWSDGSGSVTGELDFYYGCAGANPELAAALRKVPDMLPTGDLIGKRN